MATQADITHLAKAPKKHGACDECRLRKVKCSGDQGGCTRCRDEGLACHYSDKKTMGRPRKRRRDGHPIQDEGDVDGMDDGQHAADQPDGGFYPDPSHANSFSTSTAPSLSTASQEVPYTSAPDVPRAINPALDSTTDWSAVQHADLPPYEFDGGPIGLGTASNGLSNDPNHVGVPRQYAGNPPDVSNAAAQGLSCTCLTQLHYMLQSFQAMPPSSFPSSRDPLTRATRLGRAINRCTLCPLDFPTALQTSMLLITLLRLTVHGYAALVRDIQAKAAEGYKITYRVGELNLSNGHLHTGTLDCPMGFTIELDPEEWAAMARKVLKQDIYGSSQNIDCFVGVLEELEQRHQTWQLLELPFSDTSAAVRSRHAHPQDLFLQLIQHSRAVVEDLEL
ncbi:MAG: hypothetical protein L6R38_005528 [Xanthoria sp. 2 TBL-2021]|nr:MAG: hypothetical protein L6R38_005528 [Xanthoria sp. 2 TBL-2021]